MVIVKELSFFILKILDSNLLNILDCSTFDHIMIKLIFFNGNIDILTV